MGQPNYGGNTEPDPAKRTDETKPERPEEASRPADQDRVDQGHLGPAGDPVEGQRQ